MLPDSGFRFHSVFFSQLLGVAKGLDFLHSRSPPVIHGDLKPVSDFLWYFHGDLIQHVPGKYTAFRSGGTTLGGRQAVYNPA